MRRESSFSGGPSCVGVGWGPAESRECNQNILCRYSKTTFFSPRHISHKQSVCDCRSFTLYRYSKTSRRELATFKSIGCAVCVVCTVCAVCVVCAVCIQICAVYVVCAVCVKRCAVSDFCVVCTIPTYNPHRKFVGFGPSASCVPCVSRRRSWGL